MADSGFSDDGKFYCAISQDGRLKIWDTETNVLKQEYTPDLHLTSPPSCLQWINITHSSSPQRSTKRKSSICEQEAQCIALGTSSGNVLLYSVAQAKIETVLTCDDSEIQSRKIISIDWHRKCGLFSCNKSSIVYEWDVRSASVRNKYNVSVGNKNTHTSKISTIKVLPHNQNTPAKFLVTASWQVCVWRLLSGEATPVRMLGHHAASKALLMLAAVSNKSWLIQGSQNERLLSFWDVTVTSDHIPQLNGEDPPTKKQRRKSVSAAVDATLTPTYNFVLEDAPRSVTVTVIDEEQAKLRLCAVTRSGVVHYYDHILNGASTKPIKPLVTIQVTTADAQPFPLQCCHLTPAADQLLLGYSSGATVLFEKVTPDLKTKTQVLIRGEATHAKKKGKQTNEVNKVRSDPSKDVTYVEPMGGATRKRQAPGAKVEIPMEARLANLALDTSRRSKSAVNQNLTKLLVQGLHSKDKGMILTVLQNDHAPTATCTVSNLPPDYVPLLLDQLIDMATKKTTQCAAVCTWARALVQSHAALLLASASASGSAPLTDSSGSTADRLARLLAIFTHRRSHLCQLLNLQGRLDLITVQRSVVEAQHDQEPLLDYNDTSSSDEMEAERYQSDSDASWGRAHPDTDEEPESETDADGG